MSSKKELKKLKGPDAFQLWVVSLLDTVNKYKSLVIKAGWAIAAVVVVFFAARYFMNRQEEQRQLGLSQIDIVWSDEESGVNKQRQKMEDELGELTKAVEKSDANAADKTKAETRMKELQDKIAALEPNHDASYKKYKDFYENNKNYPEGWVAGIRYCGQLLKKKDFKTAEPILENIQVKAKDKLMLQILAQKMLISVFQEMKEYDRAIKLTEQMLPRASANLKAKILLEKGNIELAMGKKDVAAQTFDLIIKDHDGTQEAAYARAYKALIR